MSNPPPQLQEVIAKASVLIEALPYMQAFRGHTLVIKCGGSVMDDPRRLQNLLRDVVFLEALGINPVVVHGGGKAISRAMESAGLEARFVGGLRVTDEATIRIVEDVLDRKVNPSLVETINLLGGRARGVSGRSVFGGVKMRGKAEGGGEPAHLGFVGEVRSCRIDPVIDAVEEEIVPVVSPLAAEGGDGHTLNVNADIAAAALAGRIKATKIIYISDVLGVLRDPEDPNSLIHTIAAPDVETLTAEGVLSGGMLPKVRSAVDALKAGVGKVHFVDGRIPHSLLLEIFTETGVGTEIVA